jgi:hypothetical protein
MLGMSLACSIRHHFLACRTAMSILPTASHDNGKINFKSPLIRFITYQVYGI